MQVQRLKSATTQHGICKLQLLPPLQSFGHADVGLRMHFNN